MNAIIDGNWFLISRLFATHKKFTFLGNKKESDKIRFKEKLSQDFASIVRKLKPACKDIYFVGDNNSWRKTLTHPDKSIKNSKYKANRIRSTDMDWNVLFEVFNEFMDSLSPYCTVLKTEGAEGDDWMWFLSRKLKHTILCTVDGDMKQTLFFNKETNEWCIQFDFKKFFCESELYKQLQTESLNIFSEGKSEISILSSFITNGKYNLFEIKPGEVVAAKLFSGDKKDNVFPIYEWKSGKINKKFSGKKLEPFLENIDPYNDNEIKNKISNLCEIYKLKNINKEQLFANFTHNRKCLLLNEKEIPEELQIKLQETLKKNNVITKFKNIDSKDKIIEWLLPNNTETNIDSFFKF